MYQTLIFWQDGTILAYDYRARLASMRHDFTTDRVVKLDPRYSYDCISLVPRPVRAIRVTRGGFQNSKLLTYDNNRCTRGTIPWKKILQHLYVFDGKRWLKNSNLFPTLFFHFFKNLGWSRILGLAPPFWNCRYLPGVPGEFFPTSLTGDVTSEIAEDDWEQGYDCICRKWKLCACGWSKVMTYASRARYS